IGRKENVTLAEIDAARQAVTDAELERDNLVAAKASETAEKVSVAWVTAAGKIRTTLSTVHTSLLSLFESFGSGFQDVTFQLSQTVAIDQYRLKVQQLQQAVDLNIITYDQWERGIAAVN